MIAALILLIVLSDSPGKGENPGASASHYDQLHTHYSDKKFDEVMRLARNFIKSDPNDTDALYFSGIVYYHLDKRDQSFQYLRRWKEAEDRKGKDFMIEKGVPASKDHITISHRYMQGQVLLGEFYFSAGLYQEAERALLWADSFTDWQKDPVYNFYIGLTELELGKFNEAAEFFARLPQATASEAWREYRIAEGYSRKGRDEEALEWLRRAVDADAAHAKQARSDPDFERFRGSPEFEKICTRQTASPPANPPLKASPPYGDAYHEQAAKRAQHVRIAILADGFAPSPKSPYYMHFPAQDSVSNSHPETITKEPNYGGSSQRYGTLMLGNPPKAFNYVFDLVSGPHPVLYFDRNRNGDLTDDPGPITNQGTGIFAAVLSIPIRQLFSGVKWTGDFEFWFYASDWEKGQMAHYSQTSLKGRVQIGNRTFDAWLIDSGVNDGDLSNDGINIDLNANGKIESRTEYFAHRKVAEIDGKEYAFDISW